MIGLLFFLSIVTPLVHCLLQLDFAVRQQQPSGSRLAKRLDYRAMVLDNKQNIYTTTLSIGSNRDNVSVFVDTGSTELWVMGSDVQCFTLAEYHVEGSATLPEIFDDVDQDYPCTANGTYNRGESTTNHAVDESFLVGYTDGSAATGRWNRDDVRFGNGTTTTTTTIEQFEFATVDRTSVSNGILGLGIASNESRSFPQELRRQGFINKVAYSVYLNSADAQKGSVLFGAVDHAKYNGTLVTTSLTHDSQLMVNVTYEGGNYSVLFDTGSTYSILPDDWIRDLANSVNGTFDEDQNVYEVDCDVSGTTFDFSVAGTDFEIPIEEILARQDDRCYVGIMASSIVGGGNLFGFNILRHMYIVYDLDDMSISVAPVRYTTDEHIEEFTSRDETVSDLDPSANATTTSTGGANGLSHGSVAWCYALMAVFFYLV